MIPGGQRRQAPIFLPGLGKVAAWFKKGPGAARRALRTTVPDLFLNHAKVAWVRVRVRRIGSQALWIAAFFQIFPKKGRRRLADYARPLSRPDRPLHRSARLARSDKLVLQNVALWPGLATRKQGLRMLRSGIVGLWRPSIR